MKDYKKRMQARVLQPVDIDGSCKCCNVMQQLQRGVKRARLA
jgi:hypothetical protein